MHIWGMCFKTNRNDLSLSPSLSHSLLISRGLARLFVDYDMTLKKGKNKKEKKKKNGPLIRPSYKNIIVFKKLRQILTDFWSQKSLSQRENRKINNTVSIWRRWGAHTPMT